MKELVSIELTLLFLIIKFFSTQGLANLYDRIQRMAGLGPIFIDITWGAGGSTTHLTTDFVKTAHKQFGLETCMHLTCTNMPREQVDKALKVS